MNHREITVAMIAMTVITASLVLSVATAAAVERQLLGVVPQRHLDIQQSPDGSRVAWVTPSGSRFAAQIDGETGPQFDEILPLSRIGLPRSERGTFVFSNDGSRIAYVGRSGSEFVVVVDGVLGPRYESPIMLPTFSDNGARFVYIAPVEGSERRVRVVVDGEPVTTSHAAVRMLTVSPTGRFVTFVADDEGGMARDRFVRYVLEGRSVISNAPYLGGIGSGAAPGASEPRWIRFSLDDAYHAFIESVVDDGEIVGERVVHNGQRGRTWGAIYSSGGPLDLLRGIHLSNDGQRVAYVASEEPETERNRRQVLVLAGEEKSLEGYTQVRMGRQRLHSLFLSPDGRRYAYVRAMTDSSLSNVQFVVDGEPGLEYQRVSDFTFSPDSRRYLYTATQPGSGTGRPRPRSFVIVDGSESDAYDGLDDDGQPRFSADGRRYAFIGLEGPNRHAALRVVVIDGDVAGKFAQVSEFTFSPDGRVGFVYRDQEGRGVYLDGQRTSYGTRSTPAGLTFSADGKRVAYINGFYTTQHNVQLTIDGRQQPAFARLGSGSLHPPLLSPDGRHVVHPAFDREAGRAFFVLDGNPTPGNIRITTSAGMLDPLFLADGRLQYYSLEDDRLVRYRVLPAQR